MRTMLGVAALIIISLCSVANAQKCENPSWNYCGSAIDKCCPAERPYACINLTSPMHGQMTPGGPQQTVPRGWSGCVRPGTLLSATAWQNNCEVWVQCNDQD